MFYKIFKFLKNSIQFDIHFLRTRFFMFLFNIIPNFYILKHIKCLFLKFSGVKVDLNGSYILSPFIVDKADLIFIHKGTFINIYVHMDGNAKISIGKDTKIGPFCKFYTTNHDDKDLKFLPIEIGKNVWIGANCTILPGTQIKDNIKIAAGSVVKGDIDTGNIWAGVPAVCVK